MKTTNLKQTSVAKPRKWFQRRRRWNDPREARPERSQFRDQPPSREATASHRRSRLHLREFAKNSRIFAAFAPGASRAPQFFFHRKSGAQNSTGIRCADTPSTKGVIKFMKPIPGTLQEGGAAFQSTHWTLVLRARQSDPTKQQERRFPISAKRIGHPFTPFCDFGVTLLPKRRISSRVFLPICSKKIR